MRQFRLVSGCRQIQAHPVSQVFEILSTTGKARGGKKLKSWKTSTSRQLGRALNLLFTMYRTCQFTPWLYLQHNIYLQHKPTSIVEISCSVKISVFSW